MGQWPEDNQDIWTAVCGVSIQRLPAFLLLLLSFRNILACCLGFGTPNHGDISMKPRKIWSSYWPVIESWTIISFEASVGRSLCLVLNQNHFRSWSFVDENLPGGIISFKCQTPVAHNVDDNASTTAQPPQTFKSWPPISFQRLINVNIPLLCLMVI